MALHPRSALDNLLEGKQSICISENCSQAIRCCTSCSSPIGNVQFTCEMGGIDLTALESASSTFHMCEIISELSKQLWDLYPLDVSNADILVNSLVNCTMVEVHIFQMLSSKGILCTLLKDAIADPLLEEFFPRSLISLCQYMFLPSGINLRNLLWHGFILPDELGNSAHILCTILSIRRSLEIVIRQQHIPTKIYYSLSRPHYHELINSFSHNSPYLLDISAHVSLLHDSLFILPGRMHIFESALLDFASGRYIRFMLKVMPCLEHSLRFLFCVVNNLPAFLLAQEDTYYSTLDGFGQKSKHQLLLHPSLHESCLSDGEGGCHTQTRENMLPTALGEGAYALLLDLFFTETGPNLRGKFAHGEIDMCEDKLDSTSHEEYVYTRDMASVLLSLVLALCDRFRRNGAVAKSIIHDFTRFQVMSPFSDQAESEGKDFTERKHESTHNYSSSDAILLQNVYSWKSLYHPHRMLNRQFNEAVRKLLEYAYQMSKRRRVRMDTTRVPNGKGAQEKEISGKALYPAESELLVEVVVDDECVVDLWEKVNRIGSMISASEMTSLNSVFRLEREVVECGNHKSSPNTISSLTESVCATCIEYISAIRLRVERADNVDALSCVRTLEQVIVASSRHHILKACGLGDEQVYTSSTIFSSALQLAIERFSSGIMGIYSPSVIPGLQCCMQLCKVSNPS